MNFRVLLHQSKKMTMILMVNLPSGGGKTAVTKLYVVFGSVDAYLLCFFVC